MRYVISYDIDVNRIRNKVAKTLEGVGVRVQYSVFECELSRDAFQRLYKELFELIDEDVEGSIRFYCLCGNCCQKIVTIGKPIREIQRLREAVIIV